MKTLLERFNSKVKRNGINACWAWNGAKDQLGYGRLGLVTINGKRAIQAHRISWILFRGPIPNGLCICHHCDNPPCTNPEHLFLGTMKDNVLDMVNKGRCRAGWQNAIKTHCQYGHPFSGDNLIIGKSFRRRCRKCANERMRVWNGKNRSSVSMKYKEWYAKNRDKVLAQKKIKYQLNKEIT